MNTQGWVGGGPERAATWELVVVDDDDLRQERLMRSLRDELAAIPGLEVSLASPVAPALAPPDEDVAKAGAEIALLLTAAVAPSAAKVLVAAIESWCAQHRREVRVQVGDVSVEISGATGDDQRRLIDAAIRRLDRTDPPPPA